MIPTSDDGDDKDSTCFDNFQGGSSQAYAMTTGSAEFWLTTASNSGYTFVECGDSPSVLSLCDDDEPITCSSPVSSYIPTNIPPHTTVGDEDKSLSISGEGTFVLGLPDSNIVYISTSSVLNAEHLVKTNDPQQQFGRCVAISISGDQLAVGAPMMNNGTTTNTGGVYIYEKDSTTNKWTEKMLLQPPPGIEVNEFGKKIGFSDDDKLLAVVSNKMMFVYQKVYDGTTSVEQQYQALLFNNGPWIEFRSIGADIVANFDGGVAIIADEFDSSLYTIYGKDDGGHVVALDVSFLGVVQSHPVSPFDSL